ncbi:transposase [Mycobacterium koreense]|nr:transposase [Mycolicibacillus koreensis]ODR04946.1 hypothetical protein BHQ15_16460 [Mycolicibacillus koreensis]BBY52775.1 hypothetical protein MKOR_00260 [Mycolicibacillus koreensis]
MPFDHGPEFIARAVNDWCRFNGQLRDELLNSWRFDTLLEARVIIDDWRIDYNANRPHSARRGVSPTDRPTVRPRPTNPKPHSDWTTKRVPQSSTARTVSCAHFVFVPMMPFGLHLIYPVT